MVLEDLESLAAVYIMSQVALETGGLSEALPVPFCETSSPKPLLLILNAINYKCLS